MIYINTFLTFYTILVGFTRSKMFFYMFKNRQDPDSICLTMEPDSMRIQQHKQQHKQQQQAM